jgi:tRNA uridine 5-carbamoylmethylation protein Kti12
MNTTRKHVYLMRGIPGQGKSTIAQTLLAGVRPEETGVIVSADHFFVKPDGTYDFNPKLLHMAHGLCQSKYLSALQSGTNVIVVDNTNVRRRDFWFYQTNAEENEYSFFEIHVGNFDVETSVTRNQHAVPREAIEKMISRWEK